MKNVTSVMVVKKAGYSAIAVIYDEIDEEKGVIRKPNCRADKIAHTKDENKVIEDLFKLGQSVAEGE